MPNKQIEEIEKELKRMFYPDEDLPPPGGLSIPIPMIDGIETGIPRPPPDDQD